MTSFKVLAPVSALPLLLLNLRLAYRIKHLVDVNGRILLSAILRTFNSTAVPFDLSNTEVANLSNYVCGNKQASCCAFHTTRTYNSHEQGKISQRRYLTV